MTHNDMEKEFGRVLEFLDHKIKIEEGATSTCDYTEGWKQGLVHGLKIAKSALERAKE